MPRSVVELKDTKGLMTSPNYVDRFLAEYYQLDIRIRKLEKTLDNWNNLNFTPKCPKDVLVRQLNAMKKYRDTLDERCIYENIDVNKEDDNNDIII